MASKPPAVQAAPVNPEVDAQAQINADEVARKERERAKKNINSDKTILTHGLDEDDNTKKNNLG